MSTVVLDLQEHLLALAFSLPEIGGDGDPGGSSADTPVVSGDGADDGGINPGARLRPRRDDLAGYMKTGRGWRGAEGGGVISRTSG